ncbi:pyrroline-5-carboxylate reductase [Clostridium kluyveri]|uniref:Pyrroline-5-carboxylate reductase n=1 Tax=Clostridium kluyveri TaxID=1534 RepID=A0A1L5FAK1_CLOKL|nr:pyrroline-5-carboxylate reductase [Clostridium kluyveri]APM40029.1 pyrroline-5-carboxylate reductase [Clostridium kluyveri]UZQ49734.1 pyrroline-5-carboxylate reductase [Clostridium kluyveri]
MGKLGKKIGFIGTGQMGEAILKGLLTTELFEPDDIYVMDILDSRLQYLKENFGIAHLSSDRSTAYNYIVDNCDIVVLSIKPQVLKDVVECIKSCNWDKEKHTVISIIGGINTSFIEKYLPEIPVVRVMPNTPMLVNIGASGVAPGKNASKEHAKLVHGMFEALGVSYLVEEKYIDSITAISGCGPAYVYMMIEAMADGGVELGLPREMAQTLAAQTVMGGAKMILDTGEHPGKLKDKVCSPGGSTIAGVRALEQGAFRGTIMNAIEAGKVRMEEVGKKEESNK